MFSILVLDTVLASLDIKLLHLHLCLRRLLAIRRFTLTSFQQPCFVNGYKWHLFINLSSFSTYAVCHYLPVVPRAPKIKENNPRFPVIIYRETNSNFLSDDKHQSRTVALHSNILLYRKSKRHELIHRLKI